MLACLHFKKKRTEEMKQTFEETAKYAKKEPLFWSLYAWCIWKNGDRDEAQAVLNRGLEAIPDNERLKSNLNALRNGKKMKMRGWREQWYQFHLEAPPQPKMRMDRRGLRGR